MQAFLDRCDNTIAGWAFDKLNPDNVPLVSIHVDGQELFRMQADLPRSDLQEVIGMTDRGFSFDIETVYHPFGEFVVSVYVHGSSTLLVGERRVVMKSKVIRGSDGWLFLTNDSNQVDQRMAGEIGCDSPSLHAFIILLLTREATLEKLEIPYQVVVVPEKNVVCNVYRNDDMIISEDRPLRLIQKGFKMFGGKNLIYPADFFLKFNHVFNKTDTHASAKGYLEILRLLALALPQYYSCDDLPELTINNVFKGDLANHVYPSPHELVCEFGSQWTSSIEYSNDPVPGILAGGGKLRGSMTRIRNSAGKHDRLLIIGTSSAYYGLPAFIRPFRDAVFVWENTLDYFFVREFDPTCILWVLPERFLPTHLNDLIGLPNLPRLQPI
jgi:hypothetical protein